MFADYVFDCSPAAYASKILIEDVDGLNAYTDFDHIFAEHGFEIIEYSDDLSFRVNHDGKLKGDAKIVVLKTTKSYLPYDMRKQLTVYALSLNALFSKLNTEVLHGMGKTDLDLLSLVSESNIENLHSKEQTEDYIQKTVYGSANVSSFLHLKLNMLLQKARNVVSYKDWFEIAEGKAEIDRLSIQHKAPIDTSALNAAFEAYALENFGGLSSKIDPQTPVLVSHAMEYMYENSDRFVVIVMDGMSEFDWSILSESFANIPYEQTAVFAMIPSTTSVSRQCLLSGKFPRQLLEPWGQSKEKAEFTACAKSMGFGDAGIGYERGYNADFSAFVTCGAVIINDVDDMVHAQPQGRTGMFNDISLLRTEDKLVALVKRLLAGGFDVYVTSDHGNTLCTGIGKYIGAGVDVETKSRRMLVLKDFADKDKLIQKYGLVEYPGFYLPKGLKYLICNGATSLDAKDTMVMTHGGMTLDEVVVPFIKIKAGRYDG